MSPVGIRTLDPKFLYLIGYNYEWVKMSTLSIDVFIISIKECLIYICPLADFGENVNDHELTVNYSKMISSPPCFCRGYSSKKVVVEQKSSCPCV